MALRTFQLCLVFAVVGYVTGLGLNRAYSNVLPATPQHNVSIQFLAEPQDTFVARGQDAVLRCDARVSEGNVSISWLYKGHPLPEGDPRWTIQNNELRIHRIGEGKKNATRNNSGQYCCLARTKFGTLVSWNASVRVAVLDREIIAISNTPYASQPLVLRCNVHSVPVADIHWEFNDLPLAKDRIKYVPLPNGTLLIRKVDLVDSGNYRCIAKNPILKNPKTSPYWTVKVLPSQNSPPSFLLDSTMKKGVIGEDIVFECPVQGWPLPKVQWINSKNSTLSNTSTLILRNIQTSDTGWYRCIAVNPHGENVQRFKLDVFQRPYFNVTPVSRTFPSAQTVRIDCQANGIPQPRVTWFKNGLPLPYEVRINKTMTGLVFSHTLSTDTGIYQCVAENEVGRVWTLAQIEINNSLSPNPPQNVQCRPYDEDKICLTWRKPNNLGAQDVTGYTVHSTFVENGVETSGPEYVSKDTYILVKDLEPDTNYSFYVRIYSLQASDYSDRVWCSTQTPSPRNLDIEMVDITQVSLTWDQIETDVLCNGTRDPYVVQWSKNGGMINKRLVSDRKFLLQDLQPAADYKVRVTTQSNPYDEPWLLYSLPVFLEDSNSSLGDLHAPYHVRAEHTDVSSSKIAWDIVKNAKFYSFCILVNNIQCDDENWIKTYQPKADIQQLDSNTQYKVFVRAHDLEGNPGDLSEIVLQTKHAVPTEVTELKFHVLNSTAACVFWRPPVSGGQLEYYLLSYSTDPNWSLKNFININISSDQTDECVLTGNTTGLISTYLNNLSTELTYMVMVKAVSKVGEGISKMPLTIKTSEINEHQKQPGSLAERNHQKFGIIIGVVLAVLCIIGCITFILLRRRCLKRRALIRARTAAITDYNPAIAHYTAHLNTTVRAAEPLSTDRHEIEHLVGEENTHIPPVSPGHLDTKGVNDLPNGCAKRKNGFLNGHVHITENPQFHHDSNSITKNKSEPLLRHKEYEEDSNSNLKSSKPSDFYQLLEKSPEGEDSLNSTQITFLDESMEIRRLSPVLEPNG